MSRHKTPSVAPKIKASIEHLLHQERFDLAEAAKVGGITTERLRDDLNRPHVRKYLRDQRRTQIESVCVRNPVVLAEIRDRGKNDMARVQAIKVSEALRQHAIEEDGAGASTRPAPGLVIIVGQQPGERSVRIEPQQPQPAWQPRASVLEPGDYERRDITDENIAADDDEADEPARVAD
jgi:hypothetical protein